jgi:lipopolysaccharide transport system permease protein
VLNVFFRDVGQFYGIFLQFWFWLTPIVYPPAILPPAVRRWVEGNPMTPVVVACQDILVHGRAPQWSQLAPAFVLGLVLVAIGWRLFRRHAGEMVDEL